MLDEGRPERNVSCDCAGAREEAVHGVLETSFEPDAIKEGRYGYDHALVNLTLSYNKINLYNGLICREIDRTRSQGFDERRASLHWNSKVIRPKNEHHSGQLFRISSFGQRKARRA